MEMEEYTDLQSEEWDLNIATLQNPDGPELALKESSSARLNEVKITSFTKISLADLDKNQYTSRKLPYTRIDR